MDNIYEAPEIVEKQAEDDFSSNQEIEPTEAQVRPALEFLLDYIIQKTPKFRVVLDVGCATAGTGKILSHARSDLRYVGLDSSLPMLQKAYELNEPKMDLFHGTIRNLPFKPNSVPYVLCAGTLWYCDDVYAALEALYKITSRVLMVELMYLPDSDEGRTTTQTILNMEQKVYLLGKNELINCFEKLEAVQKFKDLRLNNRVKQAFHNNELSGLHDMEGRDVRSFLVIFEKKISAPFIKILNKIAVENPEQGEQKPEE